MARHQQYALERTQGRRQAFECTFCGYVSSSAQQPSVSLLASVRDELFRNPVLNVIVEAHNKMGNGGNISDGSL